MFGCTRGKLLALVLLCVAGSSGAATVTVTANANLTFTPSTVTINAGDSVKFVNSGNGFHNAVSNDNGATFNSGAASSSNWTFTTPPLNASIGFHCAIHSGMTGTITVNAVTPPTIKLGGYLSGNWFDPSANQGGHGFQFEFTNQNNTLLAIWFVYPPDGGGQNWIYAQGPYDPAQSTVTISAELLNGPKFPPLYNSNDLVQTPWGTLTFSFTDCDHGTASWTSTVPGYGSGSIPIQRITSIQGTACPQ
jgi:plastocyanin